MTDKERKILEEAGLLYPVPTIEEIAKAVTDRIWEAINNQVQEVRCKNCKYFEPPLSSECSSWCCYYDSKINDDGFCSYWERREDG